MGPSISRTRRRADAQGAPLVPYSRGSTIQPGRAVSRRLPRRLLRDDGRQVRHRPHLLQRPVHAQLRRSAGSARSRNAQYPAVNGQASSPRRFVGSNRQPPQWSVIRSMYAPAGRVGLRRDDAAVGVLRHPDDVRGHHPVGAVDEDVGEPLGQFDAGPCRCSAQLPRTMSRWMWCSQPWWQRPSRATVRQTASTSVASSSRHQAGKPSPPGAPARLR